MHPLAPRALGSPVHTRSRRSARTADGPASILRLMAEHGLRAG